MFHRDFKHEKTDESTRPQASRFYCFRVFETSMKHEARVFEISSPTKENKFKLSFEQVFSIQLLYFRLEICMNLKKMCTMCMVLSPNCCAVTNFEYSTTEVTLPSCLSVLSEHVASQRAECTFRPHQTSEEEEKCVASAIPR